MFLLHDMWQELCLDFSETIYKEAIGFNVGPRAVSFIGNARPGGMNIDVIFEQGIGQKVFETATTKYF